MKDVGIWGVIAGFVAFLFYFTGLLEHTLKLFREYWPKKKKSLIETANDREKSTVISTTFPETYPEYLQKMRVSFLLSAGAKKRQWKEKDSNNG